MASGAVNKAGDLVDKAKEKLRDEEDDSDSEATENSIDKNESQEEKENNK